MPTQGWNVKGGLYERYYLFGRTGCRRCGGFFVLRFALKVRQNEVPRSALNRSGTLPKRLAQIVLDKRILEAEMKEVIAGAAVLVMLAAAPTADAKGCLKGAAVGGVAG